MKKTPKSYFYIYNNNVHIKNRLKLIWLSSIDVWTWDILFCKSVRVTLKMDFYQYSCKNLIFNMVNILHCKWVTSNVWSIVNFILYAVYINIFHTLPLFKYKMRSTKTRCCVNGWQITNVKGQINWKKNYDLEISQRESCNANTVTTHSRMWQRFHFHNRK